MSQSKKLFALAAFVSFVFANLGEQAVLSKEIYCTGDVADDDVFGYQERWAEYRYHPALITGRFRSTAASTLDSWHGTNQYLKSYKIKEN